MTGRRVTLGRVAGVYGVKGWLRVTSFTRPVENLLNYSRWRLAREPEVEVEVVEGRVHGRGVAVQLADAQGQTITDRDEAAKLVGASIQVERSELPALPKGQYYWVDLIGCKVETTAGEALGEVSDMTSNGAQDVMVVMDGKTERLIPFVQPNVVKKIDIDAGRIVCDWHADY